MDKGVSEEKQEKGDEVLDGLPDGDDGWEYLERAEEESDGNSESEQDKDATVGQAVSEDEEVDTEAEEDEGLDTRKEEEDEGEQQSGGLETNPETEEEEEAILDGASEYEVSELVSTVGSEIRKNHVIAFVKRAEDGLSGNVFSPGDRWGREAEDRFVELGWLNEDAEITAQGAAVLGYAGDVISQNNGLEVALVGYLNSEGVENFYENALRRGPDEADDDDGLIGGLLG